MKIIDALGYLPEIERGSLMHMHRKSGEYKCKVGSNERVSLFVLDLTADLILVNGGLLDGQKR